jgi:hypothetical protein
MPMSELLKGFFARHIIDQDRSVEMSIMITTGMRRRQLSYGVDLLDLMELSQYDFLPLISTNVTN